MRESFFISAELADCGPEAMLAYLGLAVRADREGRLRDKSRDLKVQILPHFAVDFDALLESLADAGHIRRYEVDGERCIQISRWADEQSPHPKEPSFGLPEPPKPLNAAESNGISRHDSESPANPHGDGEPLQAVASREKKHPRAREGMQVKARDRARDKAKDSRLDSLLDDLRRVWPAERNFRSDHNAQDEEIFEADRAGELPPDLADLAKRYLEAHGFAAGRVDGCPNLSRWISDRRWTAPLPQPKPSQASSRAQQAEDYVTDRMRKAGLA